MAYAANTRVRVTDSSRHECGLFGVVKEVVGDNHSVRLDGYQSQQRLVLTSSQLIESTQPLTLVY